MRPPVLDFGTEAILRTDQNRCYDDSGRPVDCRGTGHDGDVCAGRSWPQPRFEAEIDTVRDRLTGLCWARNASLSEFPLTWTEAHEFVGELNRRNYAGRRHWRLPSRRELFSLVSHANINPALPDGHPFIHVFAGYYWTERTVSRLPDQAWYVHFGGGRVFKGMKHGSYMVWPVCGGDASETVPRPCLEVREETVEDYRTGLAWTRDANPFGRPVRWQEALDAVARYNAANLLGRDDWRLPNVRELESLLDLHCHSPALPPGHPFTGVRDGYWSSTTSVYEPSYAWVLYPVDGPVGVGSKVRPEFFLWPVRGGPGER